MREMVLTGLLACAALAVFAASVWHLPRVAERPIAAITAVSTRYAPEGARGVTATISIRASDPAMVHIYAWHPDQAHEVEAYLAAHDQTLGPWALGPIASTAILPGEVPFLIEQPKAGKAGWLYAIAIEPLSQQHGGRFRIARADLDFGR